MIAFLLAPALVAATASTPDFDAHLLPVVLPHGSDPEGEVSAVARGDFDLDAFVDVVGLVGGKPVVLWAPEVFSASQLVDPSHVANDLVVVPGPPGSPDGIATASHAGVVLWTYDAVQRTFVGAALGATPCRDVEALYDVASGEHAIAALDLAGTTVEAWSASGGAPPFPMLAVGPGALGIVAVDWIAGGSDELAVMRADGVDVRNAFGTLATFRAGAASQHLARLRTTGSPDRLAWVQSAGPGSLGWLEVLADGRGAPPLTPLGALVVDDIAGADLDGDGLLELVLSDASATELRVLAGRPAGVAYDLADSYALEVYTPGARTTAVDLDHDGDEDLVAWATGASWTWSENGAIAAADAMFPANHGLLSGPAGCPTVELFFPPTSEVVEMLVFRACPDPVGALVADPVPLHHHLGPAPTHPFDLGGAGCDTACSYYFVTRRHVLGLPRPAVVQSWDSFCAYPPKAPPWIPAEAPTQPIPGGINGNVQRTHVPFGPGGGSPGS